MDHQKEQEFLNKVKEILEINSTKYQTDKIKTKFDIIIDDGSHNPRDMIKTFKNFYPKLNPEGIYFIEDVTETKIIKVITYLEENGIKYEYRRGPNSGDKTWNNYYKKDSN